jgi:O-acetyl-ADP-ribose deacetylase (regulator of RNase III)
MDACRELRRTTHRGGLPTGQAVATTAGNLPARFVIHTVGPIYVPGSDQSALLRSCYVTSLAVADECGASSVAFPLISAGIYGWPIADAVQQAVDAISNATTAVTDVRLVLFATRAYEAASALLGPAAELR